MYATVYAAIKYLGISITRFLAYSISSMPTHIFKSFWLLAHVDKDDRNLLNNIALPGLYVYYC